jgi:predicted kinase
VNNKIVIIAGYPASGKSTFARNLSKVVNVPYLQKDALKIALCTNLSVTCVEESRLYSTVAFDAMMYVVERQMETNSPIIIEGNFVPSGIKEIDESHVIKTLVDKYDYTSLTFKFMGDTQILHTRYLERDKLPERGGVNSFYRGISFNDFDTICRDLDSFHISEKIIMIDTTDFDLVDFSSYIKAANSFLLTAY